MKNKFIDNTIVTCSIIAILVSILSCGEVGLVISKRPPKVSLTAPVDRATDVALTPTFSWQAVDGAERYVLQVSIHDDLASPEINRGLIQTTHEVASNLEIDTVYFWRVRAANSDGAGKWSEIHSFTTLAPPPNVDLSDPVDGATNVALTPTFSWQAIDIAETYALQVSIQNDLASPVINERDITETSYSSTRLQAGTVYYWRVRASNDAGDGPWSGINSFTTLAPPPQVSLTAPVDRATEVALIPTLLFSWQAVAKAETYVLQVSTNNALSSPVIDERDITETSHSSTHLQDDTVYYWRVRASNDAGDGPWSGINFFTTLASPPQVSLTSPVDRATEIPLIPTFSWQALDEAETYTLQVSIHDDLASPVINESDLTGTNYSIKRSLQAGILYYWRVRASNGAGDGEWSGINSFTILLVMNPPPKVRLSAPIDRDTGIALTPSLSWQALDEAETYTLQVSIQNNLASPVIDERDITGTSYSITTRLQAEKIYYWRVRASNDAGDGLWSEIKSFTTLAPPPPVSLSAPINSDTGIALTPSFSWQAVDGAERYVLQVSIHDDLASPVINERDITETSYSSTGLQAERVYYWRVRASNDAGDGLWSEINSFTTDSDMDGDAVGDVEDIDDDNNGLIEINSLEDLDNIRYNLAGTSYKTSAIDLENTNGAPGSGLNGYELARDLDFADKTSYGSGEVNTDWTTGSGWLPIGSNSTDNDRTRFTGIFEGNGYKITNLMIRRDTEYVGLFGYIGMSGQVSNLGIEDAVADYTGNSDSENYIGLLAGRSDGTIIAVHTSGIADGGDGHTDNVGGLVGNNSGTITDCYATGMADGGSGGLARVGGLVGLNNHQGTITACHATGNVDGGGSIGGLVGWNDGTITACYATGNVDGEVNIGGLVGRNQGGTITACYATGNADGGDGNNDNVGGLVGVNNNEGTITACYATGNANAGRGTFEAVGGLVGRNNNEGTITACYATGNADGGDGNNDTVGGLVGINGSTITACYATGNADGGDGNDTVGGLVGNNVDTITACYGFGTASGENIKMPRSDDASPTVGSASALTMANSSTIETNRWSARVWDFGTESQVPVLKWITDYDSNGATEAERYPCDEALLPAGRRCGQIIPGQER